MKRLLFVSYYVPPRSGVGTTRSRQLLAHLPRHGWDVTVVTARFDGGMDVEKPYIETPYLEVRASIRRALKLNGTTTHQVLGVQPPAHGKRQSLRQRLIETMFQMTSYPDVQAGWYFTGKKALRELIGSGQFDVVLSSAPPFTTNCMIAAALRSLPANRRIPWIADFRDLWHGNTFYEAEPLHRLFDGHLERSSLRYASALTIVSTPLAEILRRRYPRKPVYVIPNAFDAAEWEPIPFRTSPCCTLLYPGDLHGGRVELRSLFRAIRALVDQGKIHPHELRVDFYALRHAWLCALIDEYKLQDIVQIHDVVSRDAILAQERCASRLLLLLASGLNSEGILTGKLFEYLGARRRIIAIGGPPDSAVDTILWETGAGIRCHDDTALQHEIVAAVLEHRNGNGRAVEESRLASFEASSLARRFARALDAARAA